jgi:hypothetical protein
MININNLVIYLQASIVFLLIHLYFIDILLQYSLFCLLAAICFEPGSEIKETLYIK